MSESRIYGWNVPGHHQDIISRIFGFPMIVNWTYFTYLGMYVFQSVSSSQDWKAILDKLTRRIQSWGAPWLNPTGKIILIKSILSTLTIFQCVGLLAPKGILEKISKLLRGFLWACGKINTKKFHIVNWAMVCQPSGKGSLDILKSLPYECCTRSKVGLASHL